MRVPLLVLLLALAASAQPTVPEVRGTIVESGSTTPIAGVEVTLYEFGPNADNFIVNKTVVSTSTDANGAFSLKPGHLGEFSIGAKKSSYTDSSGRRLTLVAAEPVQTLRMSLTRPAIITGRVIDRDGRPVANLRVGIDEAAERFSSGIFAVTDSEGLFTASNLSPGAYLVHIQPAPAPEAEDLQEFTEAAFKIVDEDVEPSYWPGGVTDPDQVLPIQAAGGGIASAGTITVRKTSYHRVRITLNRDCAANERWTFRVRPTGVPNGPIDDRYTACRKDALITGVPPGSYELAVWSGRKVDRWALASFIVSDKNTQVNLTFNETIGVSGRLLGADGADLAKLGDARILLRSSTGLPPGEPYAEPDAQGRFTFNGVPWKSQWLSVEPANPTTYVKEIRYNGLPLRSHQLDTIPGASLDIVLDSQAASLSVTLKKGEAQTGGRVALVPVSFTEPLASLVPFPPFILMLGSVEGQLTIRNIPPGDYRLIPTSRDIDEDFVDETEIAARLARAQKITLARGEQRSIELQLK